MCPLKYFYCPDGQQVEIKDCLAKCQHQDGRCLSLPTLMDIADVREWKGVPSTTMLLNGVRLSYLEIVQDYAVFPTERAFALLGTRHHRRLEKIADKLNVLPEEKLQGEVSGILDLLVPDEMVDYEVYQLWDYKTSGSYKVAKALGLVSHKEPHPTETYKTSGKWGKAGDPKMITVFEIDPTAIDMDDWILQLNNYRLLIERSKWVCEECNYEEVSMKERVCPKCGKPLVYKPTMFPVSRMVIQATVRDGGTIVAQNRGIDANICLIPVKRLNDDYALDYFKTKRIALLDALDKLKMPPPCSEKERWEDVRCQRYCDVWQFCDHGKEVHEVKEASDGGE